MSDRGMGQQDAAAADAGVASQPQAARPARRDPFAHGDLPLRPAYLPEEGAGGRSELWSTLLGLAAAVLAILAVGWLLGLVR